MIPIVDPYRRTLWTPEYIDTEIWLDVEDAASLTLQDHDYAIKEFTAPDQIVMPDGVNYLSGQGLWLQVGYEIGVSGASQGANNGTFNIAAISWDGTNTNITTVETSLVTELSTSAEINTKRLQVFGDKSGKGNDCAAAQNYVRPLYQPNGWAAGKPTMRHDHSNSSVFPRRRCTGLDNPDFADGIGDGYVAFAVIDVQSDNTIDCWLGDIHDPASGESRMMLGTSEFGMEVTGNLVLPKKIGATYAAGKGVFSMEARDGGTLYRDGTAPPVALGTIIKPTGPDEFALGARNWKSQGHAGMQGDFCEGLIIAGQSQTVALRQKIEGYLAWKWGLETNLPIGHPYRDIEPTV